MTMHTSRRDFIKKTALWTAAGTLPIGNSLQARGTDPVLVSIFLRGGADALNICVPHGDPVYQDQRPRIAIPESDSTDLDGFFGLNNAFSALLPMYRNRELGFIQCVGSKDETRSHFAAQDFMDAATPGNRGTATGWLQRSLAAMNPTISHAGVSIGKQVNKAMAGPTPNTTINRISGLKRQRRILSEHRETLVALHDPLIDPVVGGAVTNAFNSLDSISDVSTDSDVEYPSGKFSRGLREAAAIIKGDIGVRVVAISTGGWDHHANETTRMPGLGAALSEGLAAFREDLGEDFDRTLVITMTEFGRTVKENGNEGTDHGHGSFMLGMGGKLVGAGGGKVLLAGDFWPGLAEDQLDRGRYQQVTTDFRDVFAEVADRHLGLGSSLSSILPGHTLPSSYPGLIS